MGQGAGGAGCDKEDGGLRTENHIPVLFLDIITVMNVRFFLTKVLIIYLKLDNSDLSYFQEYVH